MKLRLSTSAACFVAALLLLGCPDGKDTSNGGGTTDGGTSATDGGAKPTGKPWDDAKGTATISISEPDAIGKLGDADV